jgi:hypothetical protein
MQEPLAMLPDDTVPFKIQENALPPVGIAPPFFHAMTSPVIMLT